MAILNDEIIVEDIEIRANEIFENVQKLVRINAVNEQTRDECVYHLNKLAALLDLDTEFDTFTNERFEE